jgi:hypothetical protein
MAALQCVRGLSPDSSAWQYTNIIAFQKVGKLEEVVTGAMVSQ